MVEWLEQSLQGSILALREQGMTTLADDLYRFLSSGEVEHLSLFRNPALSDLVEYLIDIQDVSDLKVFLHHLAAAFEVDHFTLHCCNKAASGAFKTRVVTTYPNKWVTHYVEQAYSRVDPVLIKAEESAIGFYWDEIDFSFPPSAAFRKSAEMEGIGPSGFTLPVGFPQDIKIACTLTSIKPAKTFRDDFSHREFDLRLMLEALADVYFNVAAKIGNKGRLPSDLIYKLMLGLVRGKTPEQLQNELKFNDLESVTRQICNFYKVKTLWQAVAECLRLGHLDDQAFELDDIH